MKKDEQIGFRAPRHIKAEIERRAKGLGLKPSQLLIELLNSALLDDRAFWENLMPPNPEVIHRDIEEANRIYRVTGLSELLGTRRPPAGRVFELYSQIKTKKRSMCGPNALSPQEIASQTAVELRNLIIAWKGFYSDPFVEEQPSSSPQPTAGKKSMS